MKPDDRVDELRRRLVLLSKLHGRAVRLADGVFVLSAEPARDPRALVAAIRRGPIKLAEVTSALRPTADPIAITPRLLAKAHRDLRTIEANPSLRAIAVEAKRLFHRYGPIDDAWIARQRAQLERLADPLRTFESDGAPWFGRVLDLVRLLYGDAAIVDLDRIMRASMSQSGRRRRAAWRAIESLAGSLEKGAQQAAPEVLEAADRLRGLRRNRSHSRRATAIVRRLLELGPTAVEVELSSEELPELVREIGARCLREIPSTRSPQYRERFSSALAHYALMFEPKVADFPVEFAEAQLDRAIALLAGHPVTMQEALDLLRFEPSVPLQEVVRLKSSGLSIARMRKVAELGHLQNLFGMTEHAAAYCDWIEKLAPHYRRLGIDLAIPTNVFATLPSRQDLAVLAACLLQPAHAGASVQGALALLDATLGLFRRVPGEVSGILGALTSVPSGIGRRELPELADWLGDEALLDRWVHVCRESGVPPVLSRRLRKDFDRARRVLIEREHLAAIADPTPAQRARLAAIESSAEAPDPSWTRRRMSEHADELLGAAYRRHVDRACLKLLSDVWSISLAELTPAWRDAIRYYFAVEQNRELLGTVLTSAARHPGQSISALLPKNRAWLARAEEHLNVSAWLAPRSRTSDVGSRRLTISIEMDPVEVLRMGIPFHTCLSLEGGVNAASTVINAADANKRVIYARDARGQILARKLVAVSVQWKMVGYHVYSSVDGDDAIEEQVDQLARELADAAGLELADDGIPEQIHEGFWYDDGTHPFERPIGRSRVAAYCAALGVSVPREVGPSLRAQAVLHAAARSGKVERAMAVLDDLAWDHPREALAWIADALGERELIRRARTHVHLATLLVHRMAESDPIAMIRLMRQLPRWPLPETVGDLVREMEPRDDLVAALVETAIVDRPRDPEDLEIGEEVLKVIQDLMEHVTWSAWFDICDRVEHLMSCLATIEHYRVWLEQVRVKVIAAGARRYRRTPDRDAVVRCIASRRRSRLSHRVVFEIATLFELDAAAALDKLNTMEPDLKAAGVETGENVWHQIDRIAAKEDLSEEDVADLRQRIEQHTVRPCHDLPPDRFLRLWAHPGMRSTLARLIGFLGSDLFAVKYEAIRRLAKQREISIDGLLERAIEGALEPNQLAAITDLDREALRTVARTVVASQNVERALHLYGELPDEESAVFMLEEMHRAGMIAEAARSPERVRKLHRRQWLMERSTLFEPHL